uniref:Putative ovule protein n=1 Tax=Solanum chacoense TaxID=4108 RepID=A0A0V0HYW4_SOLCH
MVSSWRPEACFFSSCIYCLYFVFCHSYVLYNLILVLLVTLVPVTPGPGSYLVYILSFLVPLGHMLYILYL